MTAVVACPHCGEPGDAGACRFRVRRRAFLGLGLGALAAAMLPDSPTLRPLVVDLTAVPVGGITRGNLSRHVRVVYTAGEIVIPHDRRRPAYREERVHVETAEAFEGPWLPVDPSIARATTVRGEEPFAALDAERCSLDLLRQDGGADRVELDRRAVLAVQGGLVIHPAHGLGRIRLVGA